MLIRRNAFESAQQNISDISLKNLEKGLSAGIAAGRSRRITNDIIPSASM